MESNKQDSENNQQENTNQNANSAYSGSGGMQPGGSTGEAGRLNDYPEEDTDEKTAENDKGTQPKGKSIEEATDTSKLSRI